MPQLITRGFEYRWTLKVSTGINLYLRNDVYIE